MQKLKYREIFNEYTHSDDFVDDDEMLALKDAILSLDETDRTLLLLYTECGSMKITGQKLGVSSSLIHKNITRIRAILKDRIKTKPEACDL